MPARYLQRPSPIYFIGDSFTLVFRDRVYLDGGTPAHAHIGRSLYVDHFRLREFTKPDGSLHPAIAQALDSEHLTVPTENGGIAAYHTTTDTRWRHVAVADGRLRRPPTMVFLAGHLDLVEYGMLVGKNVTVELPADCRPAPLPTPEGTQVIPLSVSLPAFEEFFRPLVRGLRSLQELGFSRMFVHSMQPPPVDDEVLQRNDLADTYTACRYAGMVLFNYVLAKMCADVGVQFLDVWDAQTQNGVLRSDLAHVDRVHLNERAALITMEHLFDALAAGAPAPAAQPVTVPS